MRALITGSAGFVGTALSEHLRSEGDEVVSLDRATGVDITDRTALFTAVAESEADVVYHLAAQAHVPTAWDDPYGTLHCNVEGTMNVLNAAHEAEVPRVIVASSADVYGTIDPELLPVKETTTPRPNNPYAASKLAAEAFAIQSFYGRNQEVVCLRAFNQFGPGQRPDFVCAGFAHQIARAEHTNDTKIEVGRLDVRRDFSDVRDVARAYRLAALHGRPGAIYNVCSGVDRSIEEVGLGLAAMSSADIRFVQREDLLRPVDTPVVRGDASAITADTGWTPEIPFATTLEDVLADARRKIAQ